jgi:5'-methylthioadenosine phosphorylase
LLDAGFRELKVLHPETPFGTSNPVHLMEVDGLQFALLSRHGERGYEVAAPWVNDRANLYALKDLGVERILSWSSPGSLDPSIEAGDFVIPDDVLDDTRAPPFSFFEGKGVGVIRMSTPFCPALRTSYGQALTEIELPVHDGGVYAGTQGPRLETRAEVQRLASLGGTVVGMTLVPEVFLARELELCYGALCLVVNRAEGLADRPYIPAMLFEGLALEQELEKVGQMESLFPAITRAALQRAVMDSAPACHCQKALERFRRRGDLGADWRRWWD